jgi:hypothetical protein
MNGEARLIHDLATEGSCGCSHLVPDVAAANRGLDLHRKKCDANRGAESARVKLDLSGRAPRSVLAAFLVSVPQATAGRNSGL